MSRSPLLAAAAAAALALCVPSLRADPPPAPGDYSTEIKTLRERLDKLEAQEKESLRERLEAEHKLQEKIAADELAGDAARHDQFISTEGFTAGYSDGRFLIQSGDGNFTLHPWAHMQLRGVALYRENGQGFAKLGLYDQWDTGFEVARMRLGVDGNMFSPDFTYQFNWNTYRNSSTNTVSGATPSTTGGAVTVSNGLGGVIFLEEAWVKYHIPASAFYLQVGQLRDPLLHDQIVDARYQQSAERSLTADIFANGDGFTEGAMFIYDPKGDVRAEGGLNHGMRSANTNFYSFPDNGTFNQFDYGLAGRVEYKFMGHWKDYNQVGGVGVKDPLLVTGLGADYSERGHSGQLVTAADVMYADPLGFNFYGAFVDRYTTHNFGLYTQSASGAIINTPGTFVSNRSTNEYSMLLQGGYLFNQHVEPFGRYEYIRLQGDANGSKNWINCITAGVNYYFHGNQVKLTGEAIWLPNGLPINDSNNDVFTSLSNRGEISFVAQIQLEL